MYLVGFFEALIDDVMGMTHPVWPQKSKIQTQQLLLKERDIKVWALSRWNRRFEKKSENLKNLKIVTVSLTPGAQNFYRNPRGPNGVSDAISIQSVADLVKIQSLVRFGL